MTLGADAGKGGGNTDPLDEVKRKPSHMPDNGRSLSKLGTLILPSRTGIPERNYTFERGDNEQNAGGGISPQSSTSSVVTNQEWWRLTEDFVRRFTRGVSCGVGLYVGLKVATALLKKRFRESLPLIWQSVLSRECTAFAGFLGVYPSLYHLLIHLLTKYRNGQDGWTYGIAGGVGGLSVMLLDLSHKQTLAFFTLSRAMGACVSTLVSRGYTQALPHFDVCVYSACVSVIIYCTAIEPRYLTQGYYRSILKWSRDYTDANMQRAFRDPGNRFLTCAEIGLHKGSCTVHVMKDLLRSLSSFAKLYLPIHLTPVLLFRRALLLKRPGYTLVSLTKNLARSTAFLAVTTALAKLTVCVLRNAVRRPPPLPGFIPALAGAVCGLGLLLERPNRRKELTLFVIPHVLNIAWLYGQASKTFRPLLRSPNVLFTLIFSISMALVMHTYERQPDSLTQLISGILRFLFGPSVAARRAAVAKDLDTSGSTSKTATSGVYEAARNGGKKSLHSNFASNHLDISRIDESESGDRLEHKKDDSVP